MLLSLPGAAGLKPELEEATVFFGGRPRFFGGAASPRLARETVKVRMKTYLEGLQEGEEAEVDEEMESAVAAEAETETKELIVN